MDNAQKKLNSLTKDFSYEKLVELLKKYKYYIIGAVLILLIFKACGGGVAEAHQKYVGEWKFVDTDAKDGFFWAKKAIKTLTLDGNGNWDLDGDKAYGDWGIMDEGKRINPYEMKKLKFRETHWNSNNAQRIVDMEGRIESDSEGKENLVLKIRYRFFGDRLVDDGSGVEFQSDMLQEEYLNYYFER